RHESSEPDPADTSQDESSSATEAEVPTAASALVADDDPALPIADYDTLPAAQIVPLLGGLTAEEQAVVGVHENAGRGRRTILGRLQRLAEQRADGAVE
ncbi:MAG: hypothetical protein P8N02_02210, partial [Actinomycetota bacterium]|nr:hypothetical protein [Actinomycetota bacterium]